MKKILILLIILALSVPVFSQSLDEVEASFQTFSDETASVLPLMTNLGLNWNDAFSGGFPHFGVGLTTGAVVIPLEAFNDIMDLTGSSGDLDALSAMGGVPLPMYTVDARVGIPILPLDVGVKVGMLDTRDFLDSADLYVNYTMFGADVRYSVIKGNALIPEVSVGAAYTYLDGGISIPLSQTAQSVTIGSDVVELSESEMLFNWNANVVDLKAQVSKKILALSLSAGAGYSYGFSSAGGGIQAGDVTLNGSPATDAELAALTTMAGVTINNEGVLVDAENNGGSLRLFGGVGLNILLLKIDFGAVYGIPSGALGLSSNVRIQF